MANNEFEYRVKGEGNFSELQKELARLNAALANAKGSVTAFKEEIEREAKGTSEFKIVIRSEFNDSGTRVAKAEIVEVNKEYGALLNKLKQIEKEPQRNSLTSLRQQVNNARQARDAVSQYSTSFDGVGNKIRALNPEWVSLNIKAEDFKRQLDIAASSNIWQRLTAEYGLRGLSTAGRQITDFVNVFQSLSIVVGQVTASINTVVGALANLQSFNLSFKAIEAGAAGGAQALSESSRIALNLGVDLVTVRTGFQQLSPVILNTGGTIADVSNVVETLSSRFAAFGLSGDKARRVTNGIIQAFSKGKLMSEELTQQISEADPAFRTDLAGALGYTTEKLEEQVKAGKITGQVLLENLPKLSKSALLYGKLGNSAADAAVALRKGAVTIDQVSSKIKGLNQLSLEKIAKAIEPILYIFIEIGASITDFVSRVSKLDVIKSIGTILGAIGQQASAVISAFLNFAEAIINVADSINKFIGPFLQIPGVAQLAAVALTSKLIGPLEGVKAKFLKGSEGAGGFLGAIRALTTFPNLKAAFNKNIIEPVEKFGQVIGRSYTNVGLGETLRRLAEGSLSAREEFERLGQKQLELNSKFRDAGTVITALQKKVDQYKTRLESLNQIKAVRTTSSSQDKEIEDLTRKIDQAERTIIRAQGAQAGYTARLQQTAEAKKLLASRTTIFQRSLAGLRGVLAGVASGARAVVDALGPLGVALVAIGAAQSAYQDTVGESNAILEEAEGRADILKKAIEDLNGGVKESAKPLEGWSLAWATFGRIVFQVVSAVSRLIDSLAKKLQDITKATNGLPARLALILGFAGAGALLLSGFGPVGAAIGGVSGALIAFSLTADAASQKAFENSQNLEALGTAFNKIAPEVRTLGAELDKLSKAAPDSINVTGSDARTKLVAGILQETAAIQELQRNYGNQEAVMKRQANDLEYGLKKIKEYTLNVERLTAERNKQIKIRDDFRRKGDTGSKEYREAYAAVSSLNLQIDKNKTALEIARAGVISYNDEFLATQDIVGKTKEELDALIAANNKRRKDAGFALDAEDGLNSFKELQDQVKVLKSEIEQLNLFTPDGLQKLDAALTKVKAIEFITAKLSRTKVEIQVELRNLQQEISESRLKIGLEPGPLRDAALQVSKITNEFANAQTKFKEATDYIKSAANEGTINARTQKELLEEAALNLLNSSLKAKEAIIEAGREFRKQLDTAKSTYQSLVLSKPEFFSQEEFIKNAENIEKDFQATLKKVREDIGDYSFTPKIEGKTLAETLANKKAFVDTRKEADDLKKTIKDLTRVLALLVKALTKIGGVSFENLKELESKNVKGINFSELEKSAYGAQDAVTGINAAAVGAAKSYGNILDSFVVGGVKYVLAADKSTGAVETLTEAEYKAALAAKNVGKTGAQAMNGVTGSAKAAAVALEDINGTAKTVIGTIKAAGGEEIFLVEDNYTGKVESLTSAQLAQQGIVNNLNESYKDLGISIAGVGSVTGEYLKRQREELAAAGPEAVNIGKNLGIDATTTRGVMDAARRAGGDYLKAWNDTVSRGGGFQTMVLNSIANSTDRYKFAMSGAKTATDELRSAQNAYNEGLRTGQGDMVMLSARLENANAIYNAQIFDLELAKESYDEAANSARQLGIDINTVVGAGQFIDTGGPKTLEEAYDKARQKVLDLGTTIGETDKEGLEKLDNSSDNTKQSLQGASSALKDGSTAAVSVAGSLDTGRIAAEGIANALNGLDGKQINVNINTTGSTIPGLWTGGPTTGGQTYRVNELGREGFLSPSGALSPINKPKNALWKAPSKGMVIPAHIMAGLDLPAGKVATNVKPSKVSGGNGLAKIARAIQVGLSAKAAPDSSVNELAAVQAHQAKQIGKLSRAVNKLVDKNWNVNVGVRSNDSTTYLQALNRVL